MSFSNPVSAKRYSVKKKSKSELKGLEQSRLYVITEKRKHPTHDISRNDSRG